jgi:hypothetical protein
LKKFPVGAVPMYLIGGIFFVFSSKKDPIVNGTERSTSAPIFLSRRVNELLR